MGTYIMRRILQMIPIILLVTTLVFLGVRLLPGDPVLMSLSSEEAEYITQEQLDYLKHELGLDRPLIVQYFDWLGDVAHGDLGSSLTGSKTIIDEVKRRMPISFQLGSIAFILSIIIGIPVGVIAAIKRGSWADNLLSGFGNLGMCLPGFWLGILLIYMVAYKLDLLPMVGYISPFKDPWNNIRYIILPIICLAVGPIAGGIRLTRSCILEVLRQDYVRTAWAKGLKQQAVIMKHVLKNGLIPVVTVKGMTLEHIVGGSVIIEQVFGIPGMGRYAVEGMFSQDYTIIQGCLLIASIVILGANLLVDISYGWLDPRIRFR